MACSNCNTPNCGCSGTYVVSQTCPPACSEVFNAQCIVYTGVDLVCDGDTVISRNDYLDSAITKLVNYVCSKVAPPASAVAGSAFIDVVPTTDPVTDVTTYTVSADMAAFEIWVAPIITNQILAKVLAGPGIDVAADAVGGTVTVSHEDTSAVTDLSSNNSGNSFIQSINFTFDTYGHVTGASAVPGTVINANNFGQFDITDTDPGTYTWASVDSAIATNPGDTFTVLSGESIDVDVDGTALAMRIAFAGFASGALGLGFTGTGTIADPLQYTDGASAVTLTSAGGTVDLVNDGVGPALATKGLSAGAGITLLSSATDVSITSIAVNSVTAGTNITVSGTASDPIINTRANGVVDTSITSQDVASTGVPVALTHAIGVQYAQIRVIANTVTAGTINGIAIVANQDITSDFAITMGSINNYTITSTTYTGNVRVIVVGS